MGNEGQNEPQLPTQEDSLGRTAETCQLAPKLTELTI
jgi:hypothetical protein